MARNDARSKAAAPYHHGDLRRGLLDAALAQVTREGAEGLSLAALARALGVSQAAPYRHFPDRDALLAEVATEGFRMFGEALARAVAAGDPREGPLRMCRAYVDFGLARPGLYRLMFASPVLTKAPKDGPLALAARESFGQLVDAVGPAAGPSGAVRRARRIWVGLHGTVMLADQGLLPGPTGELAIGELVGDLLL